MITVFSNYYLCLRLKKADSVALRAQVKRIAGHLKQQDDQALVYPRNLYC